MVKEKIEEEKWISDYRNIIIERTSTCKIVYLFELYYLFLEKMMY